MAEAFAAFGAAASVVQVIDFGARALLQCSRLLRDVKNAPRDIGNRLEEVAKVLDRMQLVRHEMEALASNSVSPNQLDNVIASAETAKQTAENLHSFLQDFVPKSSSTSQATRSWGAIKFVGKESKLQRMLEKIEKEQNSLIATLSLVGVVLSETNRYAEMLNSMSFLAKCHFQKGITTHSN